jgi:TatD DNase family protein
VHCHGTPEHDGTVAVRSFSAEGTREPHLLPRYSSMGIHPWDAADANLHDALARMEDAFSAPHCIALGEVGLDRLRGPALDAQERVLRAQLDLAEKRDLPVILHDVRSTADLLRIRKDYQRQNWVLHGFRGSPELARQCLEKGWYLSLGPALLTTGQRGAALCAVIPPDRLFLETDDSGRDVRDMYDAALSWTGMRASALIAQIEENFHHVFGVRP